MYVSENFFDLYNSETTNITIAQYEKILISVPIITSKYYIPLKNTHPQNFYSQTNFGFPNILCNFRYVIKIPRSSVVFRNKIW